LIRRTCDGRGRSHPSGRPRGASANLTSGKGKGTPAAFAPRRVHESCGVSAKKTMSPPTWTFTGSSSFESLNTIVQEIWPGRVPCSTDPKPPLTGSVVVRAPSSSAHCELAGSARGNATTGDKPEGPSADPERPLCGRYRGLSGKHMLNVCGMRTLREPP
jgi:hypothetical protein